MAKWLVLPRYQDKPEGLWYTDWETVDIYLSLGSANSYATEMVEDCTPKFEGFKVVIYELTEMVTVSAEDKKNGQEAHPVLGC